MIDRGALLLLRREDPYRGTWRCALDSHPAAPRALVEAYRAPLLEGEGVLEDLDEATELLRRARAAGIGGAELVVFEVPQPASPQALPLAAEPPADGLTLAGWDVIELIEPFSSVLRDDPDPQRRNEFGLLPGRAEADAVARAHNAAGPADEVSAARIWLAEP